MNNRAAGNPFSCGTPTATFTRQHSKRTLAEQGFKVEIQPSTRIVSQGASSQVASGDRISTRVTNATTVTDYVFLPQLNPKSPSQYPVGLATSLNTSVATIAANGQNFVAAHSSAGEAAFVLTSSEGESRAVSLSFSQSSGSTVDVFSDWATGSLAKHISDSTYSRLAGKSPPPQVVVRTYESESSSPVNIIWPYGTPINMWSSWPGNKHAISTGYSGGHQNPEGPYIRDSEFFLYDVDFSCVSVWNLKTKEVVIRGTLVTPEHFVSCAHGWQPLVNDILYFATNSAATGQPETIHKRRVIQTASVGNDLWVGKLGDINGNTSPLPASIKPAKVLPKTWTAKMKGFSLGNPYAGEGNACVPYIRFNQDFQALLANMHAPTAVMTQYSAFGFGGTNDILPAQYKPYSSYIRFFDSGNPNFFIINGQPVLIGTHTSYIGGPFISAPAIYDAVEAAMGQMGGSTTTLTPIDLSSFPSY